MASHVRLQVVVTCDDSDRLFHAALSGARADGRTVGAYNDARRRSVHEMAFDVESVLRRALDQAGCSVKVIDNVVISEMSSEFVEPFDDVVVFDRHR